MKFEAFWNKLDQNLNSRKTSKSISSVYIEDKNVKILAQNLLNYVWMNISSI